MTDKIKIILSEVEKILIRELGQHHIQDIEQKAKEFQETVLQPTLLELTELQLKLAAGDTNIDLKRYHELTKQYTEAIKKDKEMLKEYQEELPWWHIQDQDTDWVNQVDEDIKLQKQREDGPTGGSYDDSDTFSSAGS